MLGHKITFKKNPTGYGVSFMRYNNDKNEDTSLNLQWQLYTLLFWNNNKLRPKMLLDR